MPIYEYECLKCKRNFEVLQKVNDESIKICPHCEGTKVNRIVSPAGFQLKGTGWYVTDFKDSGKKETAKKNESKSE